jgi:hypothetical protein
MAGMRMSKTMLFFLLLLILGPALSARDTVTEALRYYPLHIGDYWEYLSWWNDEYMNYYESYFSNKVTGDSIMPNGRKYQVIEMKNIPFDGETTYRYERIDSSTANVYRYLADFKETHEYLLESIMDPLVKTNLERN